ncbi:MAG: dihydrodipicolinate synthase family protein [Planctomycetota bacterium]|nr:dihydrodipicolinate synthase family protein [Planctomycetota bacterium]
MTDDHLAFLEGAITALPTPFRDGVLDLPALDRLIEHQARQRMSAILVGGATGEGWSLEVDEVGQLVARAVAGAAENSDYDLRVIFGVTEVSSERAARVARNAAVAGADALLISAPPFALPDVPGVIAHLRHILDALPSELPLITVNEPERTGTDLGPEALKEIVEAVPEVVAHCEAVGRPARARTLADALPVRLLAGDDRMIGPMVRHGACGAITVVGNLVPGEVAAFIEAARKDDPAADGLERKLAPLVDALRVTTNPVPLKGALAALGATRPDVRAPLLRLDTRQRTALERSLTLARLLVPS